jgi:hypothetical protein
VTCPNGSQKSCGFGSQENGFDREVFAGVDDKTPQQGQTPKGWVACYDGPFGGGKEYCD